MTPTANELARGVQPPPRGFPSSWIASLELFDTGLTQSGRCRLPRALELDTRAIASQLAPAALNPTRMTGREPYFADESLSRLIEQQRDFLCRKTEQIPTL